MAKLSYKHIAAGLNPEQLEQAVTEKLKQKRHDERVQWGQEFPYGTATPGDDPVQWELAPPLTIPTAHSVGWTPGNYGKGVIWNNGAIHTWNLDEDLPDGAPWHDHYFDEHNYDPRGLAEPLYIDPAGNTDAINARWVNQVAKVDPRLTVHEKVPFWSSVKTADKLHDFLMNPKSRPDLQTPEGQRWLSLLDRYSEMGPKFDPLTPWLTREWKKGRILHSEDGVLGHMKIPVPLDNEPDRILHEPIQAPTLSHWGDFLNSNHPLRRGLGDIMQHHVRDFQQRVEDWDEAMAQKANQEKAEEAAKGGEIVHQWPDNWTVRRLHTPKELENEGDAMGHCVGGYHYSVQRGDSSIYSLRDPKGQPHVTTEIRPQYVLDESGHKHKREHLQGPFSSHEMSPEGGGLSELQGKGNRQPIPEYQNRMREWFETFEKKPHWEDQENELDYPEEIEEHHYYGNPEDEDEYGIPKPELTVDWNTMVNNMAAGNYSPDENYSGEVYELAKARGEIPQLGRPFSELRSHYDDEHQDDMEKNPEWLWERAGPHPETIEDPNQARMFGYGKPWNQMNALEQSQAETQHEKYEHEAQRELHKEWLDNNPGAQSVYDLDENMKKHENTRTGEFTNEVYNSRNDPGAIDYQTQLFSWHI